MKLIPAAAAILAAVMAAGCNQLASNEKERDVLLKFRTGEYQLVKSSDVEVLTKQQASELRGKRELSANIGRYQHFLVGFRTFRFDTATGTACVLLSTSEDWKKTETQLQSCGG